MYHIVFFLNNEALTIRQWSIVPRPGDELALTVNGERGFFTVIRTLFNETEEMGALSINVELRQLPEPLKQEEEA